MEIVGTTAAFAAILALLLGTALCIFRKVFHVETDVLIAAVRDTLPGANCGACGFAGCDGFAAAVVSRTAPPTRCTVSSAEETKRRGEILGVDASVQPSFAFLSCAGGKDCAKLKGLYSGVPSCRGAKISSGGQKLCSWGCLGFGDCVKVCNFGAITIGESGIPVVDKAKCTGCGLCCAECPQGLLQQVPRDRQGAAALCSNRSTARASIRKACTAGCIKCGACEKKCPNGAVTLVNGIPKIDYSKCDSCGTCVTGCPSGVLVLLG
jgi:Na+-translocating ferredoxin:NAD+ oxidoreductase RNF subunit RnfB